MELNISEDFQKILSILILMVIPLLLILIGAIFEFLNVIFYLLTITWFGLGLAFYYAIN